jgi:hypothetical protein
MPLLPPDSPALTVFLLSHTVYLKIGIIALTGQVMNRHTAAMSLPSICQCRCRERRPCPLV